MIFTICALTDSAYEDFAERATTLAPSIAPTSSDKILVAQGKEWCRSYHEAISLCESWNTWSPTVSVSAQVQADSSAGNCGDSLDLKPNL